MTYKYLFPVQKCLFLSRKIERGIGLRRKIFDGDCYLSSKSNQIKSFISAEKKTIFTN